MRCRRLWTPKDAESAGGYHHAVPGSTLAFQSALGSTVWLIVAAVVAMYIVLGILYESFIHPITILSTLPTAGVAHCWR